MDLLPSFDSCVFCGTANPDGYAIRYHVDMESGMVEGEVTPPASACGYPGILHGGLQSAFLDDVMWWVAGYAAFSTSVTLELNATFKQKAQLGDTFTLHGEPLWRDGRKVKAAGRLLDGTGELVCEAEGLYLVHTNDDFRKLMLPHFEFTGCSAAMRAHYGV